MDRLKTEGWFILHLPEERASQNRVPRSNHGGFAGAQAEQRSVPPEIGASAGIPGSPRGGLLTFEHRGCPVFEPE